MLFVRRSRQGTLQQTEHVHDVLSSLRLSALLRQGAAEFPFGAATTLWPLSHCRFIISRIIAR